MTKGVMLVSTHPSARLRDAREAASLTREQLAAKVNKSASTIRAHETGQNNIQPDAAEAYGRALNVPAAWILYGEEPAAVGSSIRNLKLSGIARRNVWIEPEFMLPIDYAIDFDARGFEGTPLSAYQIGDKSTPWPEGTIAITADDRAVGIRQNDFIITHREKGGLIELAARRLEAGANGLAVLRGAPFLGVPEDVIEIPEKGEVIRKMEVVIGVHWRREASHIFANYRPPTSFLPD